MLISVDLSVQALRQHLDSPQKVFREHAESKKAIIQSHNVGAKNTLSCLFTAAMSMLDGLI